MSVFQSRAYITHGFFAVNYLIGADGAVTLCMMRVHDNVKLHCCNVQKSACFFL